jgi:hypothetical protein
MSEGVVMVATSYPRFPGDGVGSFMEPIAKGVAALGHEVHLVAPWHPAITRGKEEDGVHFHFFHYAPVASLNVFGYASGLRADTDVRAAAWAIAPAALAAGWFKAWRVAPSDGRRSSHGHWAIPGGVMAAAAAGRLPLVIICMARTFVAERHAAIGALARRVFRRAGAVTACSDDLHQRALALGADPATTETVPRRGHQTLCSQSLRPAPTCARRSASARRLVFTAGRLVSKKGFRFRLTRCAWRPHTPDSNWSSGEGDLDATPARTRRWAAGPLPGRAVPGCHRAVRRGRRRHRGPLHSGRCGNVDGLPNCAGGPGDLHTGGGHRPADCRRPSRTGTTVASFRTGCGRAGIGHRGYPVVTGSGPRDRGPRAARVIGTHS